MILLRAAAACDRSAQFPVPAAAPVVAPAALRTVSSGAFCALHGVFGLVRQWRGAGGTQREDHFTTRDSPRRTPGSGRKLGLLFPTPIPCRRGSAEYRFQCISAPS